MRPSWQIDLKWVFGLALLAAVLVSGVLYSLAQLTERDPATGAFAGIMSSFAKEGGDPEGYADIQAAATANPDVEITIDRVTFPVKGEEIVGLSYDQAIDLVVLRLAEILYTDGPAAVEGYFEGRAIEDGAEAPPPDLGVFAIFTQDSHDGLLRAFGFSLVPVFLLLLPVAFFSRGPGRLGSIGAIATLGTLPFAILWVVARETAKNPADGAEGAVAIAVSPTVSGLANDFLVLFAVAGAAAILAATAHIALWLWRLFRPAPMRDDTTAAPVPETGPGGHVPPGGPAHKAPPLPDASPSARPAAPSAQLKRGKPADKGKGKDKDKEQAA